MIHHLSIAAHDPKRVAEVFAQLFAGACIAFPPNPGAYMAIAGDRDGTAIEVHPADSAMKPGGPAGAAFVRQQPADEYGAFHFALSVACGLPLIEEIAAREGWACHVCSRGGDFDVVELWIENRFMVELLPPAFAAGYRAFAGRFVQGADHEAMMAGHERT